jgi:hypothetical protein
MAKSFKISEDQISKMHRKASREENLGNGWVGTHKVHKSDKAYSRKNKKQYLLLID